MLHRSLLMSHCEAGDARKPDARDLNLLVSIAHCRVSSYVECCTARSGTSACVSVRMCQLDNLAKEVVIATVKLC